MDSNAYRNFLLENIPGARKASGGKEVLCRCFECPDSKDPRAAHFYISIPRKDEPSKFYCQKCKTRGYVTDKKLLQWGIYDDRLAIDLIEHNRKCAKNFKVFEDRQVFQLYNDSINQDELSLKKLDYINKRLGLSLTYQDLMQLKIVLNLKDVILRNNLNLTRQYNIVNELDKNFLGFISLDNAFCNLRRLCKEGKVYSTIDKRYVNYALHDKFDNTERFYTIPTMIDLSGNSRVQIHMAEGPFDILSIYCNLRKDPHQIYTAVGGSNFKGLIRHFITTLKLPFIELHIYPDNDQFGNEYVIQDLVEYIRPLGIPFYLHRNMKENEKDFGVRLSNIIEQVERLN